MLVKSSSSHSSGITDYSALSEHMAWNSHLGPPQLWSNFSAAGFPKTSSHLGPTDVQTMTSSTVHLMTSRRPKGWREDWLESASSWVRMKNLKVLCLSVEEFRLKLRYMVFWYLDKKFLERNCLNIKLVRPCLFYSHTSIKFESSNKICRCCAAVVAQW